MKKMTLNEFMKRLGAWKGKFRLEDGQYIRTRGKYRDVRYWYSVGLMDKSNRCPIEAVAGLFDEAVGAAELNLPIGLAGCIIKAADGEDLTSYQKQIRRRMLKAVGLKERA